MRTNNQFGQSLVEVIVAATVGILVVTALTFATIFSIRNASFAKNSAQATKLAQEGIERVKAGRDRNQFIRGGGLGTVDIWNNDVDTSKSVWNYQINGNCGTASLLTYCYFNVTDQGELNYVGVDSKVPSGAEPIPSVNPIFHRVIVLSDDANYTTQKTVTAIVQWTDFAGPHESKLTTILRKL